MVIFDGFRLLDLAGAADVFSAANQIADESCCPWNPRARWPA